MLTIFQTPFPESVGAYQLGLELPLAVRARRTVVCWHLPRDRTDVASGPDLSSRPDISFGISCVQRDPVLHFVDEHPGRTASLPGIMGGPHAPG